MTQYYIQSGLIHGEIEVPPSKSQMLRAILFAAMGTGKSVIHNHILSSDSQSMLEACRLLGAKIAIFPNKIEIEGLKGKIDYAEDVINAGNSGIVLRFCSAVGALAKNPIVITGDESIRKRRPMKELLSGLDQLGAHTKTMLGNGYAPVIIQGPIVGERAAISGEDSQPVSALLIAAAFAEKPIEFSIRNPGEKPWVGLTLNWFERLGIPYKNCSYESYQLFGKASYRGFEYSIPGDFSAAAFPVAAALITGSELTVKNLDFEDPQGDKEIIEVFRKMGAKIEIDEKSKSLYVAKGGRLQGISVDINGFIDAIAILAVVSCFAEGETEIKNARIARTKECDRINCLAMELKKMGADIEEREDGLIIRKSKLKAANLFSHHDHRMAMSLAVAALGAKGTSIISSADCVSKTYPEFVKDFQKAGCQIEVKI